MPKPAVSRETAVVLGWAAILAAAGPAAAQATTRPDPPRPLLRDYMGLCVHTVLFQPERYAGVCRLVRDYHSLEWDVGNDPSFVPPFPKARNGVDWLKVYGSWKRAGLETDVSIQFGHTPPKQWKDMPAEARAYGRRFARFFGPSSKHKLVTSVEIGNEPTLYDDAGYRVLFENMARGLREGDPKLRIVTCGATPGKSTKWAKSLSCLKGLEDLYDVISIHVYAELEGWPTWRRSCPEDPKTGFLKSIADTIAWRDAHAPGKAVWLTEFGWDASTRKPADKGTFARWVGVTDLQQAQYLVRAFLAVSRLDVERAYIFFFQDEDKPSLHASSGLVRNGKAKPSLHAVRHLYRTLGGYRFVRARQERPGDLWVYEFGHATRAGDTILAAWSPTGSGRRAEVVVPVGKARIVGAERMPTGPGDAPVVRWGREGDDVRLEVGESPVYVWLKRDN